MATAFQALVARHGQTLALGGGAVAAVASVTWLVSAKIEKLRGQLKLVEIKAASDLQIAQQKAASDLQIAEERAATRLERLRTEMAAADSSTNRDLLNLFSSAQYQRGIEAVKKADEKKVITSATCNACSFPRRCAAWLCISSSLSLSLTHHQHLLSFLQSKDAKFDTDGKPQK